MIKKILSIYSTLYHECTDFIMDPVSVWNKLVEERRSWPDIQKRLLYPMLSLIFVCGLIRVFVENFYISGYDLTKEILVISAWPVILAISLMIAAFVGSQCIEKFLNKSVEFERMASFLSYVEIPLFLSVAIYEVLPFMFSVLIFINFYTAYVIMSGYNVYFADVMGEDRKYHLPTTIITFVIIYALTYLSWSVLSKI